VSAKAMRFVLILGAMLVTGAVLATPVDLSSRTVTPSTRRSCSMVPRLSTER